MTERLYLVFPDQATSLQVAKAISGNPDVETLPADGWVTQAVGGEEVTGYYNIDTIGTMHDAEGAARPGWHVNGLWHGPGPVPAVLEHFRIHPETPERVFG